MNWLHSIILQMKRDDYIKRLAPGLCQIVLCLFTVSMSCLASSSLPKHSTDMFQWQAPVSKVPEPIWTKMEWAPSTTSQDWINDVKFINYRKNSRYALYILILPLKLCFLYSLLLSQMVPSATIRQRRNQRLLFGNIESHNQWLILIINLSTDVGNHLGVEYSISLCAPMRVFPERIN